MKIGVIADTHIPITCQSMPHDICKKLEKCDLIIHAGDLVEISAVEELKKLAEVKAVWGNMDGEEVRNILPEKLSFEVEGKTIGVYHGKGPGSKVIDSVKRAFRKKPDIVIFGHSHTPFNETIDGTLYFNPGSPTDRTFTPYRSFGLIEIKDGNIQAKIIKLED